MWTKFLRYFFTCLSIILNLSLSLRLYSMISFLSYSKPQAPEKVWAFLPFLSLSFFSSFLPLFLKLPWNFLLIKTLLSKRQVPSFPASNLHPTIDAQGTVSSFKDDREYKTFLSALKYSLIPFSLFGKKPWLLTRLTWVVGNNYQYFRNFKSVLTNAHKEVKCKLKFQLSLGFKQCHK